ncbi:Glycosyltransferase involved in cell wall bisynthesis [Aquimarina amphilecti]|uniref:Glycosyltransferase involved in cell wall bisynthesis n=1 Tax=Aquimarina amphilecti TaxID=1038014 RepID=A0A1H7WBL9_AQUAM|nr:glycosyltransferase [Aquimarina amphilecti]SEM18890.1 Glycosyltransferase involved in cell wall bisynthesis [Aquimarina amphilecti]
MKILLVGEYSRLHNSLKEGLTKNGHEVTIVGNGDVFKKYPVDIDIDGSLVKNNFVLNKIRHLIFKITSIDIASLESYIKFKKNKNSLSNYDFVQLINETPFNIGQYFEKKLLAFLFQNNKNVFLLACGDDFRFISYLLSGKFPYSTLTPLLKDRSLKKQYEHTLKFVSEKQKKIHNYVFSNIKGVIPASVEYKVAYKNTSKVLPLIPNPVNTDSIKVIPFVKDKKVKILHGINTSNYLKKGNKYFEDALTIIKKKYPNKIELITTKNLPYNEYIKHFVAADIILDQAQAHDQGYNALEGMAMGKVVFTGAGDNFRKHYDLKEVVAIDTSPDSIKIAQDLERLILKTDLIREIGENARKFIQKEHHYINIATKYIEIWKSNS